MGAARGHMNLEAVHGALVTGRFRDAFREARAVALTASFSTEGNAAAIALALQALSMEKDGTQVKDATELLTQCGVENPSSLAWDGLVAWLTIHTHAAKTEEALSAVRAAISATPARLEQSKAESLTRFAMDELIAGDQVAGAELLELADALLSDPFKQEMGTRLVAQENARLLAVNENAFEAAAAAPPVPGPEPAPSVPAVPAAVPAAPASVAVVHAPQQLNAAAAAAQRGRQAQGGSVGLVQGLINQVGGLDGILKGLPPVLLGLVAIIALWKLLTSKLLRGPKTAAAVRMVADTIRQAIFFR